MTNHKREINGLWLMRGLDGCWIHNDIHGYVVEFEPIRGHSSSSILRWRAQAYPRKQYLDGNREPKHVFQASTLGLAVVMAQHGLARKPDRDND